MEFKHLAAQLSADGNKLASSRTRQVSFPAAVFSKTPTRQRHILLQAASKTHTPIASAKKLEAADPNIRFNSPTQWDNRQQPDKLSMRSSRQCNKQNRQTMNSSIRCMNHPQKAGTYETKDEKAQKFHYCQKCAILLASQGFKVSKLIKPLVDRNESFALRRAQMSTILELTQESLKFMNAKKQQIRRVQQSVRKSAQEQLEQAEQYFEFVHSVIDQYKQSFCSYIMEEESQSSVVSDQLLHLLDEEIQQIDRIVDDVTKNDDVALRLREEKYTPVIEFYKMKMSSYRNSSKLWTPEDIVPRRLDFRQSDDLINMLGRIFQLPSKMSESVVSAASTRKIKGKSVQFSFEGEYSATKLAESVIPELIDESATEQNLLDSFVK